jgi:hypothetical protein
LLAICAGLMVADRRRMTWALLLPYLAVLGVQTWGLWVGRGVNPPSTVNAFPGAIGYYVVQLLIFGLAFAVADQLRIRRVRRSTTTVDGQHQLSVTVMINLVISAVLVGLWQLHRNFFDPGNTHTHTGNGSPPLLGVLGMGALLVSFAVLMALAVRRRFISRRAVPVSA